MRGIPEIPGSFPEAAGGRVIIEAWAKSDVGKQRFHNEDCFFVRPDAKLLLVLDGMGGHRAGEVASALAMNTIIRFYDEHVGDPERAAGFIENYDPSFTFQSNLLRQAAYEANRVVLGRSLENTERVGMGSTLIGAVIDDRTVSVANVGDSRMYLIRDNTIEQISKDHTLAEDQVERGLMTRAEACDSRLRHILSSVIGVDSRIRVHLDELTVFPGDVFLLCTDGLTAVMTDEEILEAVTTAKPGPETIDGLLEEANRRGGPDNTTIVLAVFSEEER